MIKSNRATILVCVCFVLVTASLACNAPGMDSQLGAVPSYTVDASIEDLDSFNSKWRSLNLATPDGPFTMTFTEAELTSAVVQALENAQVDQDVPIVVQDVQVLLYDGAIHCYAAALVDPIDVNGYIAFIPSIDANGQVQLDISEFQFGPLEMDDTELAELVDTVEYSINEPIQASPFNIDLQTIVVSSGELLIEGTISQ